MTRWSRQTGTKLLAHHKAGGRSAGVERGLAAGDVAKVGRTVELEVMDTPGHSMSHVCLRSHTETPALFCVDTLFNAGAGNCNNGGRPGTFYRTFAGAVGEAAKLPDATRVYPGHDDIDNNLRLTLDREPGNAGAAALLEDVQGKHLDTPLVSTLGLKKEINIFFRLPQQGRDREAARGVSRPVGRAGCEDVFLKLRELRNLW